MFLRRHGDIDQQARIVGILSASDPPNGDREGEIVFGVVGVSRGFLQLHSNRAARVRDTTVERQLALRFVGCKPAPFGTIGLQALVQFAAPLVPGDRIRRLIALRRFGMIPDGDGLRRVTEVA